jgi:hypothetical protein
MANETLAPEPHRWHRTDFCSQCGLSYAEYADTKVQCRNDVVAISHLRSERILSRLCDKVVARMLAAQG